MAFQINPETGYLEDPTKQYYGFSSDDKKKFIKYAADHIDKHKNFAPVSTICQALGIQTRTFYQHLQVDKVFKQDWMELQARLEDYFQQAIGTKAHTKQGTLANIAALRRITMGTDRQGYWGGEGLNPIAHNSPTKSLIAQFPDAIDAEIVPEPPQIPQQVVVPPSDNNAKHANSESND